jgi:hypothetical protein
VSEDRIYLRDLKAAGFCVKGSNKVLANVGVDFRQFARHGMSVAELRRIEGLQGLLDHVLTVREKHRG